MDVDPVRARWTQLQLLAADDAVWLPVKFAMSAAYTLDDEGLAHGVLAAWRETAAELLLPPPTAGDEQEGDEGDEEEEEEVQEREEQQRRWVQPVVWFMKGGKWITGTQVVGVRLCCSTYAIKRFITLPRNKRQQVFSGRLYPLLCLCCSPACGLLPCRPTSPVHQPRP